MRVDLFRPEPEGEARLLLLIDAFTRPTRPLEGRTKLAKLDFLLRYPRYFQRALRIRATSLSKPILKKDIPCSSPDIESRMVRFRYGPWDPSYYALLGRLLGKGLIQTSPYSHGLGYRTTKRGSELAESLSRHEVWRPIFERIILLRRYMDLSGTTLKNFIYDNFPEVTRASWGEEL